MLDQFISHVVPYLLLGGSVVLTGMGLPVPEEVFVIGAGLASSNGVLEPWLAWLACLIRAILGDCAMYAIGYHFGHGLLRDHRWFAKLMNPRRERQMEGMIRKHGIKVFLTARFLVGVRSPVYVAAGILRVSFRQFLLFDALCATLVVSVFFGLSYAFAEHIMGFWDRLRKAEMVLTVTIIAGILAAVAYFFWRRRNRWHRVKLRRLRRAASRESRGQDSGVGGQGRKDEEVRS
jgi:membrane protein DedA with SNARE-associated domain